MPGWVGFVYSSLAIHLPAHLLGLPKNSVSDRQSVQNSSFVFFNLGSVLDGNESDDELFVTTNVSRVGLVD